MKIKQEKIILIKALIKSLINHCGNLTLKKSMLIIEYQETMLLDKL